MLYLIQETLGNIPGKVIENSLKWEIPPNINQLIDSHDYLFKDFILKIMAIDPRLRYSAKEALQHPWLN